MSDLNGIINILKPPGMSSFQVVSSVRKIMSVKKAGHTGTLDPAAVGVLPVCLGKATKIIPFIPDGGKEYIAEISLGIVTDTLDGSGEIISKNDDWQNIDIGQIKTVLEQFTGKISQIPPMYSAIHHKGKRLYHLARQGKEVEREAREIEIKEIELLEVILPLIKIRVLCSKGTYIRTLADDIGKKLKVGAHLSKLIRSKSGSFTIDDAVTLRELEESGEKNILPVDYPLNLPSLNLKKEALRFAENGVELYEHNFVEIPVDLDDYIKNDGRISVYYNGSFISINQINIVDNNFVFKPLRVFNMHLDDRW